MDKYPERVLRMTLRAVDNRSLGLTILTITHPTASGQQGQGQGGSEGDGVKKKPLNVSEQEQGQKGSEGDGAKKQPLTVSEQGQGGSEGDGVKEQPLTVFEQGQTQGGSEGDGDGVKKKPKTPPISEEELAAQLFQEAFILRVKDHVWKHRIQNLNPFTYRGGFLVSDLAIPSFVDEPSVRVIVRTVLSMSTWLVCPVGEYFDKARHVISEEVRKEVESGKAEQLMVDTLLEQKGPWKKKPFRPREHEVFIVKWLPYFELRQSLIRLKVQRLAKGKTRGTTKFLDYPQYKILRGDDGRKYEGKYYRAYFRCAVTPGYPIRDEHLIHGWYCLVDLGFTIPVPNAYVYRISTRLMAAPRLSFQIVMFFTRLESQVDRKDTGRSKWCQKFFAPGQQHGKYTVTLKVIEEMGNLTVARLLQPSEEKFWKRLERFLESNEIPLITENDKLLKPRLKFNSPEEMKEWEDRAREEMNTSQTVTKNVAEFAKPIIYRLTTGKTAKTAKTKKRRRKINSLNIAICGGITNIKAETIQNEEYELPALSLPYGSEFEPYMSYEEYSDSDSEVETETIVNEKFEGIEILPWGNEFEPYMFNDKLHRI